MNVVRKSAMAMVAVMALLVLSLTCVSGVAWAAQNVAKVGDVEYPSINEALKTRLTGRR